MLALSKIIFDKAANKVGFDGKVDLLHKSFENLKKLDRSEPIKKGTDTWYNTIGLIGESLYYINGFVSYFVVNHPLFKKKWDNKRYNQKVSHLRAYAIFYNNLIMSYIKNRFYSEEPKGLNNVKLFNKYSKWFFNRGSLLWDIWDIESFKTFEDIEQLLSEFFYSVFLLLGFVYHPYESTGKFVAFSPDKEKFKKFREEILREVNGSVSIDKLDELSERILHINFSISQKGKKDVNYLSINDMYIKFVKSNENSKPLEPLTFQFVYKLRKIIWFFRKLRMDYFSINDDIKVNGKKVSTEECKNKIVQYIEKSIESMGHFYDSGKIDFLEMYQNDVDIISFFYDIFNSMSLDIDNFGNTFCKFSISNDEQ